MNKTYQVAPDPTPMTLMGVQVRPMGMLTPPRTTPKRPRRVATAPLLEDWTLLQHCTVLSRSLMTTPGALLLYIRSAHPVLHWLAGGASLAAARMARVETMKVLEYMLVDWG